MPITCVFFMNACECILCEYHVHDMCVCMYVPRRDCSGRGCRAAATGAAASLAAVAGTAARGAWGCSCFRPAAHQCTSSRVGTYSKGHWTRKKFPLPADITEKWVYN